MNMHFNDNTFAYILHKQEPFFRIFASEDVGNCLEMTDNPNEYSLAKSANWDNFLHKD